MDAVGLAYRAAAQFEGGQDDSGPEPKLAHSPWRLASSASDWYTARSAKSSLTSTARRAPPRITR